MALKNNTATGLISSSPRSLLIRIEVLVFLGVTVLFLLVTLGAFRRRSSNKLVKIILWASYAASYSLVSYTLGLIQSFPYGNGLFSVWAICLFMLLGSADSISAYSLEDNEQWKRFSLHLLIQSFWVGWVLGYFTDHSDFKVRVWCIYTIVLLKSSTRIASFKSSASSKADILSQSTKCIADYMSYDQQQPRERDPVTMRGYRYMVAGEDQLVERCVAQPPDYLLLLKQDTDSSTELVTVEQIWECKGSLLLGERGRKLKDLCLSMALSKMLNRRFAGFQVTEPELCHSREFLFDGLLHGDSNSYSERALRVIEVELAFVHDYFYTKYYSIYTTGHIDIILSCIMIPFCISLAYRLWLHFWKLNGELNLITAYNRNYDALLTFVIVVGMALIELFQVYLYLASSWCKVALVKRYAVTASWQSHGWIARSVGYILSLKAFRYWEDSLGQYTLLQSFGYKPIIKNALHYTSYLALQLVDKGRKGCKKGKPVRISREIKEAVLKSLKHSNGQLTKGVTSLQANQVLHLLSWACNLPTAAHTILAWHIATTICEQDSSMGSRSYNDSHHALVACTLSKYCAYLVVFAPRLLPDHSFVSRTIVDALVGEASELLRGVKTVAQRCNKLVAAASADPDSDRLIIRGARLGVQLTQEIKDPAHRWKVLHDFWVEFMIYVAPSEDTRAHLETLTRGGEFITHLWVLLTHGGILDRETTVQNHVT